MPTAPPHSRRRLPARPVWGLIGLALLAFALLVYGCGGGDALTPGSSHAGAPADGPPGPPSLEYWQGRLPQGLPVQATSVPSGDQASASDEQSRGILELKPGWNLVSLPVARVTGLQVGAEVLGHAFCWDTATGTYQPLDLGDPAALACGEGTGRGFWVYARQASTLGYVGWPNRGDHADPEVNLVPGWNLLGFPYDQAQAFAQVQIQAPKDVGLPVALPEGLAPGPGNLLFRKGYAPGNQGYQPLDLADPSGAFQPGQALWVYVNQADTVLRYGQGAQEMLTSCRANLMALATAARLHAMDNDGHYPDNLSELTVRHYLATIPTCPSAGTSTYLEGYETNSNPDAFTVYCKKANHTGAGVPANYPQYGSWGGLLDHQAP